MPTEPRHQGTAAWNLDIAGAGAKDVGGCSDDHLSTCEGAARRSRIPMDRVTLAPSFMGSEDR